jgi:hypothetical protein
LVSEQCKEDRVIRNLALVCDLELGVITTEMYCGDAVIPHTFTFDLKNSNVAHEAQLIELSYLGQKIEIGVNK